MIEIAGIVAATAVVFLAVIVGLGWVVADRVVRPRRLPPTPILEASAGHVRLKRTALSQFQGPLGLLVDDEQRHVPLGSVSATSRDDVTRETPGKLSAPAIGRVVADPFGTPAMAGLDVEVLRLCDEGSEGEAWVLQGPNSTSSSWAVLVHGAMSGRESMLRFARSFAANGFTSIAVSYRGDTNSLPSVEASVLGQTEWADIEAAVSYAALHGADRIVLAGVSMGATISLRFVKKSTRSNLVDGLALVAPIIDWRQSIRANVRAARMPSIVASSAMWLMAHRPWSDWLRLPEPVRFDELDFATPAGVALPTLIVHTQGDPVAPYEASRALSAVASELVTLVPVEGADHALEWNRDTASFDHALKGWLSQLS